MENVFQGLGYNLNPSALMEKYFYVIDKERGSVPYKHRKEQRELYKLISERVNKGEGFEAIILKARQLGFSTFAVLLMTAMCMCFRDQTMMLVAHRQDTAEELYEKVLHVIEKLPQQLKPKLGKQNSEQIQFESILGQRLNSKILIKTASASNDSLGRGISINFLHCSEYPRWQGNKEAQLNSLFDSCSANAIKIIESTAQGYDDFRDRYIAAEEGKSNAIPLFYAWFTKDAYSIEGSKIDEYDAEERILKDKFQLSDNQLAWRRWKIREYGGDVNMFHQEFPSTPNEAFIASGTCVFDLNKLNDRLIKLMYYNPKHKGYFKYSTDYDRQTMSITISNVEWVEDRTNGYVEMYDEVNPRMPYVVGIDTAGDGSDYLASIALDNVAKNHIATIHSRDLDSKEYSRQLYCLGSYLNNALLVVETNYNAGVVANLKEFGYPLLYITEGDMDNFRIGLKERYGFRTTPKTRPPLIDKLKDYVNYYTEKIMSKDLLKECQNFVRIEREDKNGKVSVKEQANAGSHDDLVMSLGLALMGCSSNQITNEMFDEEAKGTSRNKDYEALFGYDDDYIERNGNSYDSYF